MAFQRWIYKSSQLYYAFKIYYYQNPDCLTHVNLITIISKGYYVLEQEELKSSAVWGRFILSLKTFSLPSHVQPKLFIFKC